MKKNKICGILNLTEAVQTTYPLTLYRPVAGLPFGCRYRLIDFPLTHLTAAGVETIGVFMNDNHRSVSNHVGSGREWDLDSLRGGLFFFSSRTAEGGYGQFRMLEDDIYNYFKNIEFIEKSGAEYAMVMGTRTLCNIDVQAILRSHIEQDAEITAVYKKVERLSSEDLQLNCMTIGENGRVTSLKTCALQEKTDEFALNMEIYLMKSALLMKLIRHVVAENEWYSLSDVLHQAIVNLPTNGFEYTGYLKSIHSIRSYYDANIDMLEESNRAALLKGSHRIHTKIKNEVPTYYGITSKVSDALVANGCMIKGKVSHSLIFRNVTVEKSAVVRDSIVMQGSSVGEGSVLQYVILDKEVRIAPNTKLVGTKEKPLVIEKKSVVSLIREEI